MSTLNGFLEHRHQFLRFSDVLKSSVKSVSIEIIVHWPHLDSDPAVVLLNAVIEAWCRARIIIEV